MIINVGSTNPSKISAVKRALKDCTYFMDAEIKGVEVSSEVASQPKSLKETIQGARNRARNSFDNCKYSIGLESGIFQVPYTLSGYMDLCACAIYDGKEFYLGLSSAFEYPKEVVKLLIEDGLDVNEAFVKVGLTKNPKIGSSEGAIGFLTNGRVKREDYTIQAINMALIHLPPLKTYT